MKKEKTLEQYKDMGAKFRVFKTMACQLSVEAAQFLQHHSGRNSRGCGYHWCVCITD